MKGAYPTIFTKVRDEKDTVLVEVPDFDITTEGYGMADAIIMARDAIGQKGVLWEDEKRELPKPREMKDIDVAKGVFAGTGETIVSMVDIDFSEYRRKTENKAVRKNVTIPGWMDYEAEKADLNLSRILQDALAGILELKKN